MIFSHGSGAFRSEKTALRVYFRYEIVDLASVQKWQAR